MPEYTYVARDRSGKSAAGTLFAADDTELRHILRSNELFVTEFRARGGTAKSGSPSFGDLGFGRRIKTNDLVILTRQLASMLRAGVPLVGALDILKSQSRKPLLVEALEDVQKGINEGESLSDTMRRHPKVFGPLTISLVTAGEASGNLDAALDVASEQLDREAVLRQRVKTAMTYPKIVVVAAVGTIAGMLTFVVPVFADVYRQLNTALPAATMALIAVSDFMVRFGWMLLLLGIAGAFCYRNARQTKAGRYWLDAFWLGFPVLGPVLRKLVIARFVQSLAGGLRGGVPVMSALLVSADTSGNAVIEEAVQRAAERVRDGASLAEELETSGEFPIMVTRMIAAGEASGNVDATLDEVNRFYDREVNHAVEAFTRMLEPLMTVLLGSVVLLILTALYMPIFNIGKALSGSQ